MKSTKPFIYTFLSFWAVFILASCSSVKQVYLPQSQLLASESVYNKHTYTDTAKNALAINPPVIPQKKTEAEKLTKRKEKAENIKHKFQHKITEKTRLVLAPKILDNATQKWRPREERVNITWQDILFVFVLLILLALLGGLIHNYLNIGFNLTVLIVAVVGFLVMCTYLWYLNNA